MVIAGEVMGMSGPRGEGPIGVSQVWWAMA